ncbi:MAG: hypothetical protein CRN43_09565 [Candidatus Nephrothrix sp. EaCA]|nr:MAG: hypothetical protein CRN43_09565 [Candidatus Nephrothrix sp. EaCA]
MPHKAVLLDTSFFLRFLNDSDLPLLKAAFKRIFQASFFECSIYRRRNESTARENAVGLTKTGLFLNGKFKIRS